MDENPSYVVAKIFGSFRKYGYPCNQTSITVKHTSPAKLANEFTEQVTVADGDGDADRFLLIVVRDDIARVMGDEQMD